MPHALAALECGALSEWRATLIVRESACLDVEDRRTLDAELCADPAQLDGMGDARIAARAKTIAYRLDPHAVVDRAARAENERTVTIRPAPDTMTYLTALLPVAQGVAAYAALNKTVKVMPLTCLTPLNALAFLSILEAANQRVSAPSAPVLRLTGRQ